MIYKRYSCTLLIKGFRFDDKGSEMKLSIIVPVYNLEDYISTTLESLLNISLSYDYEILVINDGSTDRSEDIIKKYQSQNSIIRLFTIENGGVSNARNFGIKKANGKYITFVDGDDMVNPKFFEMAIQELEESGYDFVQGNFEILKGGTIHYNQYVENDIVVDNRLEMYEMFFCPENKLIHNSVWGKVYVAELVRNTSFDRTLKVAEDQKFVFDILSTVKKVKLLSEIGVKYVQRESSVIHTIDAKKIEDKIAVLDYCKEKVACTNVKTYIDWHRILALLELYRFYVLNNKESSERVYKSICEINISRVKRYNSKKNNVMLWVLTHMRNIFNFYVRCKGY